MDSTDSKDNSQVAQKVLQHFILTRFNLFLWNKAKGGRKVRTAKWLEHRFSMFEKYCLPSVKNQTCQDFEWIVLFDSMTPESFKTRIAEYQKSCPQLKPVFVDPKEGRFFAEIFRKEIVNRLSGERVISTYLDNDDALDVRFVEDLQQRFFSLSDGTFIFYDEGYQYYAEDKYMMGIVYPKNHFVSVVEEGNPSTVKGIFGYGSHYYINKIEGVQIEHVKSLRMWCEVIHEKNVENDAHFLNAKIVRDRDLLQRDFAIDETVESGLVLYLFKFLPRYGRTFIRRTKNYLLRKI
jgi:hypothetical protein